MKNQNLCSMLFLFGIAFVFSCQSSEEWIFEKEILLKHITPIGLVASNQHLWLSDVANNRIIKMDLKGKIIEEYPDFERPMHIALHQSKVYVPEYTTDTIKVIADGKTKILSLGEKPDAPSGIAVSDKVIAIADFYNHRIIVQTSDNTITFGKEGHNPGELYYPTDVEIRSEKIYVADAYNNRVQVFDLTGNHLQIIGEKDDIQVATGIEIGLNQVFVTDFEGDRLLVYDLKGVLKQILKVGLDKPSDLIVLGRQLMVVNYGNSMLTVFKLQNR